METILAICLGIGLSAAVGLRVFLPVFVVGLAASTGYLTLIESATWMQDPLVIAASGVASVIEVVSYKVPWVDNLLDVIASPLAVIAGTLLTASFISDMSPALRWLIAAVAGGGTALTVQGVTTAARATSSATTGGALNIPLSIGEDIGSMLVAILTVLLPLLIAIAVIVLAVFTWRRLYLFRKSSTAITVRREV